MAEAEDRATGLEVFLFVLVLHQFDDVFYDLQSPQFKVQHSCSARMI